MKRLFTVLVIFGCAGAALSALDVSIGGGGQFTADWTGYTVSDNYKKTLKDENIEYKNSHFVGGGFYAFLDVTYAELNVGMLFGNSNTNKIDDSLSSDYKKGVDLTVLKIGLFGKYPIPLQGFVLFPMLGLDGQILLGGKAPYGGGELDLGKPENRQSFLANVNQLWIKAGAGADITLTGSVFLRPEFLYGIGFNTDSQAVELADQDGPNGTKISSEIKSIFNHGLDLRVAIGYRF